MVAAAESPAVAPPAPPARVTTWRTILRDPALVVWGLFVLLGPLYVVRSGLPQPGDALIFLVVPLAFIRWNGTLDRTSARTLRPLLWFTLWVAFVNYGWATIYWKWTAYKDYVIHPVFYLFNVLVFFSSLVLARRNRDGFLRLTVAVVYASIVVQVAASFFYRTDLYRGTVFFNSPNQLGYYALLSACLFAMAQRPLQISRLVSGIGVTCCAYLATLSASRASVAGIMVLLVVLLFSNPRAIIIASLAGVALASLGGPLANAIEAAEERATHDRDPRVSFAEERGYDRLWENPEYLVLGAGEGDVVRFANEGQTPRELHSSFGAVVFGYGIVGVVLFFTFFVRVVRGASLRASLMLVPALMYTVAHQGLRFTMFWIVLAAFAVLKQVPSEDQK